MFCITIRTEAFTVIAVKVLLVSTPIKGVVGLPPSRLEAS